MNTFIQLSSDEKTEILQVEKGYVEQAKIG